MATTRAARRAASTSACVPMGRRMGGGMLAAPFPDGDDGPAPRRALNLHLVHQALGPGQPHAQALSRSVARTQDQIDIGNARSGIGDDNLDALTVRRDLA